MKAVFDTNILIDYLNGIEQARREFEQYRILQISIITFIEVMVGVQNSDEENVVRGFLDSFQILDLSEEIGRETIHLRRKHKLKIPDAIVYATARSQGGMLVTRNTKDFKPEWVDIRVPYSL